MSYKLSYTTEEKIKLAKDNSVEKLYESKKNQRTVRVLTVLAYILTVSMAAIILSAYYVFLWRPASSALNIQQNTLRNSQQCEKFTIPEITAENIAIRLINETDLTLESYLVALMQYMKQEESRFNSLRTSQAKFNRNEFNQYLSRASRPLSLLSSPTPSQQQLQRKRKMTKKDQKNMPDDEDDIEISGDKEMMVTTNYPISEAPQDLNDTTIVFDQDIE